MGIKRCPSFSKRPGFPCGLRVLLLDANQAARDECEQLLKECSYEVRDWLLGAAIACWNGLDALLIGSSRRAAAGD